MCVVQVFFLAYEESGILPRNWNHGRKFRSLRKITFNFGPSFLVKTSLSQNAKSLSRQFRLKLEGTCYPFLFALALCIAGLETQLRECGFFSWDMASSLILAVNTFFFSEQMNRLYLLIFSSCGGVENREPVVKIKIIFQCWKIFKIFLEFKIRIEFVFLFKKIFYPLLADERINL